MIGAVAGIAGLALDATGVGAPVGLILEGVSLSAGGVAIAADCNGAFGSSPNPVSCTLDVAGEVSGGVGFLADGINVGLKGTEAAYQALKAVSVSKAFGNSGVASAVDGGSATQDTVATTT